MIDGSGYPLGLKEKDIPFLSQILAVTDIYNALTTDRPYRKAMSKEKALEIMSEMPINQKILKKLGEIL
jgi:HD-GYP domain-containing protein (c-di-GMP phosphodiesterase class II)